MNVWHATSHQALALVGRRIDQGGFVQLRLGIDIACRAAHQASLADDSGGFIWTGRRFRTSPEELERLWAMLPDQAELVGVTVIMEPTRNAWVPLAAWFRRRGATVVLVPPEQAADLRAYYHKHTKTDRLDSRLLARLPLLHPDGLHAEHGLGPGDVLRRATKLRATLVKRRTATLSRLDALLELLGPGWLTAFCGDLANKTPLRFFAAGYGCPYTLKRLGAARVGRFLYRHSRGSGARKRPPSCSPPPTRPWRCGPASWTTASWPTTSPSKPASPSSSPRRSTSSTSASSSCWTGATPQGS